MNQTRRDEQQKRVAEAVEHADPGSNHQTGVDGDDVSSADQKAEEDGSTGG